MNKALRLGLWKYWLPLPRPIRQGQVRGDALLAREHGLGFMSDDHHRVRDFVVIELPRVARLLSAATISELSYVTPPTQGALFTWAKRR